MGGSSRCKVFAPKIAADYGLEKESQSGGNMVVADEPNGADVLRADRTCNRHKSVADATFNNIYKEIRFISRTTQGCSRKRFRSWLIRQRRFLPVSRKSSTEE